MDGDSTTTDTMTDPMIDQDDIAPDVSEPQPPDPGGRRVRCADHSSLATDDVDNTEAELITDEEMVTDATNDIASEDKGVEVLKDAATDEASTGETTATDDSVEIHPFRVVEAILFCTDTPLPAANIAKILGVGTARDVKKHIAGLNADYEKWGLSFRVEEIAGGFQMLTIPAYNTWLTRVTKTRQETKLSPAAMETLSIVAYKQPCTRADIEAIRGVAAGDMLNRLREMNLVKIVGRAEDLGRPLLYGTTRRFLEIFGLPSLEDLPMIEGAFRDQASEAENETEESGKAEESKGEEAAAPAAEEGAEPVESEPLADAAEHEHVPHLSLVSDEDPESGEATDEIVDDEVSGNDALNAEAPAVTEPTQKSNEDAPETDAPS